MISLIFASYALAGAVQKPADNYKPPVVSPKPSHSAAPYKPTATATAAAKPKKTKEPKKPKKPAHTAAPKHDDYYKPVVAPKPADTYKEAAKPAAETPCDGDNVAATGAPDATATGGYGEDSAPILNSGSKAAVLIAGLAVFVL
jgi:hypothetical protein